MCTGTHPFIPAPGTARLQLLFQQQGQNIENVLYYHKAAAFNASDLATLCADAKSSWQTHLAPHVANDVTMVKVIATDVENEFGPSIELATPGVVGLSTGTPAPNGISFRIKVTTAFHGKNFRGGPYHIGILTDDIDSSTRNDLKAAVADDLRARWAAFFDDAGGPGISTLAIVSYCHARAWRTVAVVTPYLNVSYTDLHLDRQWRRMP